jgi:hypothetical protein
MVLKPPMKQTDEDTQLMVHLKSQHGELAVAIELAQDFAAIVRERQPDRFDSWRARRAECRGAPAVLCRGAARRL